MARTHGRAPRGQRLRVGVPHGHWETTTVVAALTLRGMIAPFVLSGPINREAFEAYVERVFNPIENAFARLKALLRKAAERTVAGLWSAIACIVDLFNPAECANYFAAAGYDAD
jgi:hypothetical protein